MRFGSGKTDEIKEINSGFYVGVLILALCLNLYTQGQSGRRSGDAAAVQGEPQETDDLIRVRTEEILVPVSVREQAGNPVSGLKAESFFVYDNGVRQEIESFNRQRVPANIVLLLDASGSVFSQMRFIREAAKGFLESLLPEDKVCVMQFADNVELLQDWSAGSDTKTLAIKFWTGVTIRAGHNFL